MDESKTKAPKPAGRSLGWPGLYAIICFALYFVLDSSGIPILDALTCLLICAQFNLLLIGLVIACFAPNVRPWHRF